MKLARSRRLVQHDVVVLKEKLNDHVKKEIAC